MGDRSTDKTERQNKDYEDDLVLKQRSREYCSNILLVAFLIFPTNQQTQYVRHYNGTSRSLSLCVPIQCKGQLIFCTTNYTSDTCEKCPSDTYILDSLNSSLFYDDSSVLQCIERGPWSCPPEAKLVDFEEDSDKICECDISRGYFGEDFRLCRKGKVCPAGEELNNGGKCQQCDEDSYKSSEGFGPCVPRKNCQKANRSILKKGSATTDTICGNKLEDTEIIRKGVVGQVTPTKRSTHHIELITLPTRDVYNNCQSVGTDLTSSRRSAASAKYSPSKNFSYLALSSIQNSLNIMNGEISGLNACVTILSVVVSLVVVALIVDIVIKLRKRKPRKSNTDSRERSSLMNSLNQRSEQPEICVTLPVQPTDEDVL